MPTDVARKPLSARSVVLSLLLGAHPRGMTPLELTRAGEHFGVAVSTVRVALTRAVAAGELQRDGSTYRLGPRLLARQQRQADHDAVVVWDGSWEFAVVVGAGRPSGERAALRGALTTSRLAELREGVWLRPANLRRALPEVSAVQTFRARPDGDPRRAGTAGLWDLTAWAREAVSTLDQLATTTAPATRLAVAAHLVRHLATDPLLPPELCPADWPAPRAWEAYERYQQEVRAIGR